MQPTFKLLNHDWNADPVSPDPAVRVAGSDLLLTFAVNTTQFAGFVRGDIGALRFVNCKRFRLGPPNEAGWLKGQCRFSGKAPAWGEFYLVNGEKELLEAPHDWRFLGTGRGDGLHFLFYFKHETFECVADSCAVEPTADNALGRTGKKVEL
jgi:hypothetical protein